MKTLYSMVVKTFFPVFLVSITFFVLLLEMVDLFANLWRYLNQDVALLDILRIQILYLPKCVSFSIPISILFSVAYSLGEFYSKNELIAVFGAGISLYRFIIPLLFFGLVFSLLGFIWEETLVINTFLKKNEMVKAVLNSSTTFSNTNVTILGDDVRLVYHADYFNDENKSLSGILVVERDEKGKILTRIDAETAIWKTDRWEFSRVRIFRRVENELVEERKDVFSDPKINILPVNFRKLSRTVDEMSITEAREWITTLKRAGLPYRESLTQFHKRFSFAFAPLVVAFLSGALGGWFRKNILLMSLLTSLVLSVVYYVTQMVMILLAKLGYVAPSVGAWAAFLIFSVGGIVLMRYART